MTKNVHSDQGVIMRKRINTLIEIPIIENKLKESMWSYHNSIVAYISLELESQDILFVKYLLEDDNGNIIESLKECEKCQLSFVRHNITHYNWQQPRVKGNLKALIIKDLNAYIDEELSKGDRTCNLDFYMKKMDYYDIEGFIKNYEE